MFIVQVAVVTIVNYTCNMYIVQATGHRCLIVVSLNVSKLFFLSSLTKVAGVKVYPSWNKKNRAHAVTACIGLWHHGAKDAVCACISLWCIEIVVYTKISMLWCHWSMHAITAWDLKFQVCLCYTLLQLLLSLTLIQKAKVFPDKFFSGSYNICK